MAHCLFVGPGIGAGVALFLRYRPPAPLEVARWRVIGNYVMAIPHLFLLGIFFIGAFFYMIVAWFSALFTGSVPPGAGAYLAGVLRYQLRVQSFQYFLRESYPAFALPSGYAEPGGDATQLAEALGNLGGVLLAKGQYAESKRFNLKALGILRRTQTKRHSSSER